MKTTTIKLTVFGDSHDHLAEMADEAIAKYLGLMPHDFDEDPIMVEEEPDVEHNLNYEMIVSEAGPDDGYLYKAEVIARFKRG
jgi:hypothetical protein